MNRKIFKNGVRCGMGLGLLLGMISCAEQQEPINRVQANALDKTFFLGPDIINPGDDPEFLWRGYIIDASANQQMFGPGSWSHIDRIKWEVTEGYLIARKSYPLIDQPRDPNVYSGVDSAGTLVAMYKIQSHFDIRRGYDSLTGEERNVIEENSTDRPWYERQYMRVDWSSNRVNDPMWFDKFLLGFEREIQLSPVTYSVTDPNNKDAPHFELENGYFDVTNRFYVEDTSLWDCWIHTVFHASTSVECDAQEATVRLSFVKLDPENDFEPLENSRATQDIVGNPGGLGDALTAGILTPPRLTFDPWYGFDDENFVRLANIHNIWKKSHQDIDCDAKSDGDNNGTDDPCEKGRTGYTGNNGSQCDPQVRKCTIPYRDREIKTVGYWVNDLMPAEFDGANKTIVYSWNQMLANAVAYAREVECRRTGEGDRDSCHGQFFSSTKDPRSKEMVRMGGWLTDVAKDPIPVLTLCHNPVVEGDITDVCGPVGYSARLGDIRRNFIAYWPYGSAAPYGGLGNWNGDPLTGQIWGASAMTMGRSVHYAAAMIRDILQIAMEDTTLEQLVDGVPQDMYFDPALYGRVKKSMALSAEEIEARTNAMNAAHAMQAAGIKPLVGAGIPEKMASFSHARSLQVFDSDSEHADIVAFEALVAPILGTKFEIDRMTPSWMLSTTGKPRALDMMALDMLSPLRGLESGKYWYHDDVLRTRLEARGACFHDIGAAAVGSVDIPGLAKFFREKYADQDIVSRGNAIYQELLPEIYAGIALHEMGHSLGMLHQFASSWDSSNFQPQYWQLRTADGTGPCTGNPGCMGPRYLDGETEDEMGLGTESRPGINYFANASTMEYQWERFGETAGLGAYDQHAMKALYGRVLETIDPDVHTVEEQRRFAPRMRTQLNEQDEITKTSKYGTFPHPVHYTELARELKIFDENRDCRPAEPAEQELAKWRIVRGQVCAPAPRDHAAWQDFLSDRIVPDDENSRAPSWHTVSEENKGGGKVRWFYRFGANSGFIHTSPSDAGADPYEVAVNVRRKFEVMYPFGYFRRHSREDQRYFTLPQSTSRNYYERERKINWHATARAAQFYASFGPAYYAEMADSDDWLRPYLMAAKEAFDMLVGSVLLPQPGRYSVDSARTVAGYTTKTVYDTPGDSNFPAFSIPIGTGRYIDSNMDSDPTGGGSWAYQQWVNRFGFDIEKAFAFLSIADTRPPAYTPSKELFLDSRVNRISFHTAMPDAVERFVGGILAEDWEALGGHYTAADGYAFPDLSKATERPANAFVLFPNVGYEQQNIAAMWIAIYSWFGRDTSLNNRTRIWIDGIDGKFDIDSYPSQVRFFNPISGMTYVAFRYGTEPVTAIAEDNTRTLVKTVEKGVAAKMLTYANQLAAHVFMVRLASGETCADKPSDWTPVLNDYGQVDYIDDNGNSVDMPVRCPESDNAFVQLNRYMGLVDGSRQLGLAFGAATGY